MLYRLQAMLDSPVALTGVALALLAAIAWYFARRQPHSFRAFDSDGGQVLVTRKAVRELVQKCCEQLGEVGSAHARVHLRGGEVRVQVALRVLKNANVKGISGYLREQISQALTENLGIEKLGEIKIVVVGILADKPLAEA